MFARFSKILVVDDSALQRKIMSGLLRSLGFDNLDEASNGRMALEMLATHTYRLVLSDWDMEPVNGPELLRAMRADFRWKRIPFLMATTQAQIKFTGLARDNGATFYIAKPFTAEMLKQRMALVEQMALA